MNTPFGYGTVSSIARRKFYFTCVFTNEIRPPKQPFFLIKSQNAG